MTNQEKDRIESAIRHIESSLDVDPWACEIAVNAMKAQLSEAPDCISRQAAIDCIEKTFKKYPHGRERFPSCSQVCDPLYELPSAEPECTQECKSMYADVNDTISRQAAIDAVRKAETAECAEWSIKELPPAQQDISEYSDRLWKAAYERGKEEAVIRCKDCKYWMPHSQLGFDEENGTYHDYCGRLVPEDEYYAFYRNAEDYCSRAERRENG